MSLHEKGDQTRALNHNSDFSAHFRVDFPNSQTFANFASKICRRGLLSFREYRAVSSAFRIGTDEKEPSFSKYIGGADGKWYSVSTGKGYAPQDIPANTADTYVASKSLLSK